MFRDENASQDWGFQLPPQLAESRNPLLPRTLGVRSVNSRTRDSALRTLLLK